MLGFQYMLLMIRLLITQVSFCPRTVICLKASIKCPKAPLVCGKTKMSVTISDRVWYRLSL